MPGIQYSAMILISVSAALYGTGAKADPANSGVALPAQSLSSLAGRKLLADRKPVFGKFRCVPVLVPTCDGGEAPQGFSGMGDRETSLGKEPTNPGKN